MLAIKLASRNLLGAGLRTWLNVIVLSFSYVFIIWHKGLLDGWDRQAKKDMIAWEMGQGQFWQKDYDPYDPFSLQDSHAAIPKELSDDMKNGVMTPILITQATIYPNGRFQSVLLKGIDPKQEVLKIPSQKLDTISSAIPVIIGKKMAENNKLKVGDLVTLRWRDVNGTFDATEIEIAAVFQTDVPTVDRGNVWIPIRKLQEMMQVENHATLIVHQQQNAAYTDVAGWKYKPLSVLTKDFDDIIQSKVVGGSIFYFILLLLALLAIFDTQVLSIFRRQKEIGTYVALGMTRQQVVALFTTEGTMNAVLAAIVGAAYGIPLLGMQATNGISMGGVEADDYGIAMTSTIFPVYSIGLVLSTIIIIMLTTTLISYWPARKISKMKPTDALRGEITMIKFLFKGLIRDKHRSVLPITVVALGVMLTVFFYTWLTGVMGDAIEFNAKYEAGHVKIMSRAYSENVDQIPNDLALMKVDQLKKELADEPTANLDAANSHKILNTMQQLNRDLKTTFIFATHDEKVIQYIRRKIFLADGKVVKDEIVKSNQ